MFSLTFCLIEVMLFQVYNKVDQISIEEVDRLARRPNSVVIRSHFCVWCSCFFFLLCVCSVSAVNFFVMFQLWDEVEPGLPLGDVMGILVPDLHLYQEKRRYIDSSVTCTQMQFFNFKYFFFFFFRAARL